MNGNDKLSARAYWAIGMKMCIRDRYEGEIHYNGYEYDFEIDADTGTITKWEVEQEAYE